MGTKHNRLYCTFVQVDKLIDKDYFMRVLITGGGTGGHINPGIAIANKIKEQENLVCALKEIKNAIIEKNIEAYKAFYRYWYSGRLGFSSNFVWV